MWFFKNKIAKKKNDTSGRINRVPKLPNKSIAIDLGANVGDITAKLLDAGAVTVYAFEPNPYAFSVLKERFKDDERVICLQKAGWIKNETVSLYFHENSDSDEVLWSNGSSLLEFKGNVLKDKNVEIEAIDICMFIQSLNQRVNLIKMDIEGVECDVLNRMIDLKIIDLVDMVFVETHDHKIPELKVPTQHLRERIKREGIKNINLNWI